MNAKIVKIIGINIMLLAYPFAQACASPVINLNLGQSSTIGNPQPFFCSVTNANDTDKIDAKNRAVLITGFSKNGRLSGTVRMLNTVYFKSYNDPHNKNENGMVTIRVQNPAANITCELGMAPGRTLMPGDYGTP